MVRRTENGKAALRPDAEQRRRGGKECFKAAEKTLINCANAGGFCGARRFSDACRWISFSFCGMLTKAVPEDLTGKAAALPAAEQMRDVPLAAARAETKKLTDSRRAAVRE